MAKSRAFSDFVDVEAEPVPTSAGTQGYTEEVEPYPNPAQNDGWTTPPPSQPQPPTPTDQGGAAHTIPNNQPAQQRQPSPLAKNFGDSFSTGAQSFMAAVRDGIVGQNPYQLPLVARGKNQWEAGFDTLQGWLGGSIFGGFAGVIWILALPDNRSGALSFALTGLGAFLAVFAFSNFPITRWVRRVPCLGWVLGHQRGFLFYLSALVNFGSMAVGLGPLWWLYNLIANRIV